MTGSSFECFPAAFDEHPKKLDRAGGDDQAAKSHLSSSSSGYLLRPDH